MREPYNKEEVKKTFIEFYEEKPTGFSPKDINNLRAALESVNYDLYDFFEQRAYEQIVDKEIRFDAMSLFLEWSPLRDAVGYNGELADYNEAFMSVEKKKAWTSQPNHQVYELNLDDETIRSLFLMDSEEDLWKWFADGHGDWSAFYQEQFLTQLDKPEIFKKAYDFLKVLIANKVPDAINVLKTTLFEIDEEDFFDDDNIGIAQMAWDLGIADIRREFLRDEQAVSILKRVIGDKEFEVEYSKLIRLQYSYNPHLFWLVQRTVDQKSNIICYKDGIVSYFLPEWADNILKDESINPIIIAQYGEKIRVIGYSLLPMCDDFRPSGEMKGDEYFSDLTNQDHNNIVYLVNREDDRNYLTMYSLKDRDIVLYKKGFDYYNGLGLPNHVIGVNKKETIVNVNFGVLFPLTDGNELDYKDIKWFDECVIDESLALENYDGFKVIENGVERIIQPTNKAYLEWRDKMLKRNQ